MMLIKNIATTFLLSVLSGTACVGHAQDAVSGSTFEPDMVVIAYNSYDSRSETLVFASVDENEDDLEGGGDAFSTINAGMGSHLWQIDQYGPELKRGWMFRLRLTIQAVMDEYNRRGQQDFIAMVSDAADVYVSKSINGQTVAELKRRFLHDFPSSQIVFSTQVYCCNPWELHSFGRADWDRLFMEQGPDGLPPSMYKHLNAGLYMGYASAIIQMADEMKIWTTDYHRHEGFWSLVGTKAAESLRMEDLEVDDDEWQISAWFFRDQDKETPLASLDFEQHLFAVTGTFRAAQDDEGYQVYSREHFFDMFGPLPASFTPEDIGSLTVCPYDYDKDAQQWTNQITGGHPLVFHFAGNDWLCACTVFAAEGFTGITSKFRNNCQYELAKWYDIVQNGIQHIASVEDPATEKMVHEGDELIVIEPKVAVAERRLDDNDMNIEMDADTEHVTDRRQLGPYRRELGPYRRELGPYRRELGPYRRELGPYRRELGPYRRELGPYRRELGPYRRELGPYRRELGPYRRELGPYRRQLGPYRRQLGPYRRELGPYRRELGPYRRQLGPYRRQLGPYRRQLGPYRRQLRDTDYGMNSDADEDVPNDGRQLQMMKKGPYRRELQMMKKGPYRRELSDTDYEYGLDYDADEGVPHDHRQLQMMKKGPYRRELGDDRRSLQMMKKGPYRRELQMKMKMGPYRRQLGDRGEPMDGDAEDVSYYHRQLQMKMNMKMGPYRRQLGDRGEPMDGVAEDVSYYHRQLQMKMNMKMGPYRRQLGDRVEFMDGDAEDVSYYHRQLKMNMKMKMGPYRRQLGDRGGFDF